MDTIGLENEKKFMKLVNLYKNNNSEFNQHIKNIQKPNIPEYARFPSGIGEYLTDAIKCYLKYNEFMLDYVQYVPDPTLILGRGGKKKTYKTKKYGGKKTRKSL